MKEVNAIQQSFLDPDGLNPFPTMVTDEYLSGEIVFLWSAREHSKHLMTVHKDDMLKSDAVLGELLFRQKRELCRLGRNGGWLQWLTQNRISRSIADRLALEHAEFYGLTDELPHRNNADPIEGRVCQAACRAADHLNKFLPSPKSRMAFVQVLAGLFELQVEREGDSVRLNFPPPQDDVKWENMVVPNVVMIGDDGVPKPVNYELRNGDDEASAL